MTLAILVLERFGMYPLMQTHRIQDHELVKVLQRHACHDNEVSGHGMRRNG